MKRAILILAAAFLVGSGIAAVTLIDLAHQVQGVLPISNGGTNLAAVPGTSGQLLFNNGGAIAAEDPIVSFNYVQLFAGQSATTTATSSAVRLPQHSGSGVLVITGASITGSPSGCTISLAYQANSGTPNSSSQLSQAFTPANSYQEFFVQLTGQAGDLLVATYNCGTFPTAGTISVNFDEIAPTVLASALPSGTNSLGTVGLNAGTQSIGTVQPGNTANTTPWLTTDSASSATGSAPPTKASFIGGLGSGATGGDLTGLSVGDTYKVVNVSTATTTLLITGVSGRKVHISSIHLLAAGADNVALIEGTGATCGTSSAGMAGGTTAASGYNFSANGGIALGNGLGTVMQTATAADSVCVVTSAAVQLSGGIQYAIW